MKQIKIGDNNKYIFFRKKEGNDIIEVEMKKFDNKIRMNFSLEELKIGLRFITED